MRHRGTTRTKRLPVELVDTRLFLALLEQCRRECVHLNSKTEIGSPAYVSANALMDGIDSFAEIVTGRRDYFHLPAHSADTSYKG
jgi:hypothetical protein